MSNSDASSTGRIRVRGVDMDFSGRPEEHSAVLEDVDLDVSGGEFVSLLGPSGCGKSTLLKIIGGILEPSAGGVTVGEIPAAEAVRRRQMGIVFQSPILLNWKTAQANVSFFKETVDGRKVKRRAREQAIELLEMVGLRHAADRLPMELSGGMAQRVAIARALSFDPPLLLMDEPFGALDEITRSKMNLNLQDVWSQTRKTIVFVTHSIAEAVFLSDVVHMMGQNPGRIVESVAIDLPRPRRLEVMETAEFARYERALRHHLLSGQQDDADNSHA